jgi:hypothetical protein
VVVQVFPPAVATMTVPPGELVLELVEDAVTGASSPKRTCVELLEVADRPPGIVVEPETCPLPAWIWVDMAADPVVSGALSVMISQAPPVGVFPRKTSPMTMPGTSDRLRTVMAPVRDLIAFIGCLPLKVGRGVTAAPARFSGPSSSRPAS